MMALAQGRTDTLAARIEGLGYQTTGWTVPAREGAVARLTGMGLPTRRDEYWRYTDPASLTAPAPLPAKVFEIGRAHV